MASIAPVVVATGGSKPKRGSGRRSDVCGPASSYNRHFTHPVAGFMVADLDAAVGELRAAGAEIVLEPAGGPRRWAHFRAPDGFLYELAEDRSSP